MKRLYNFRSYRDFTATVQGCEHRIIIPATAIKKPDGLYIEHCPECGPARVRRRTKPPVGSAPDVEFDSPPGPPLDIP